MAFEFGTPNYNLPQTVPSDKRDWADTNIPFLNLDQDLHYTKELAEGFDGRISAVEDAIDDHEVRLTELEKFIEDGEDGSKHEYEPGNLFLKDGRVCVAITEIHEGHELVEGQNYEVYISGKEYELVTVSGTSDYQNLNMKDCFDAAVSDLRTNHRGELIEHRQDIVSAYIYCDSLPFRGASGYWESAGFPCAVFHNDDTSTDITVEHLQLTTVPYVLPNIGNNNILLNLNAVIGIHNNGIEVYGAETGYDLTDGTPFTPGNGQYSLSNFKQKCSIFIQYIREV